MMKNDLEKFIEKEIDEAWEKELKDSISKKLNPILEKKYIEINQKINAFEKESIENIQKYLNVSKNERLKVKMNKKRKNLAYSDNENYLVNAVITCLFNIEPLILFFLGDEKDALLQNINKINNDNFFSLFVELFNNIWLKKESKINSTKIHNLLQKLSKEIYNSNDPGVILSFILLKLDEELLLSKDENNKLNRNIKYLDLEEFNKVILNNKTIISEEFFINYKIENKCENCCKDYFVSMDFYQQKPLINLYLNKEIIPTKLKKGTNNKLEGKFCFLINNNKKEEDICQICEKKQKFIITNYIEDIHNNILIINLNREFDSKQECNIVYPKILQLEETKPANYELISVLSIFNKLKKKNQRYSVFCKDLFDESWYEYNDENIKLVENENEILNGQKALLLFYKKI